MVSLVLDCSIAVSWCLEDEASPDTDELLERVLDRGALVPSLWFLEIGNVLLQAERRGRIPAGAVEERVALLAALPITVDFGDGQRFLREILPLARSAGLTTYDATYLDLALRNGLPLATKDHALAKAARSSGIDVLPSFS